MNCPNCGAAMSLIESRRYFRCDHCSTYHFPEALEADGIRIVGHAPDAPKCPLCSVAMAHALLDDEYPIDFCARCRGILLPRPTFAIVTAKRRAWAATAPVDPVPLDRRELQRRLACPRCGGPFDTYPHLGPGAVVVDNCARCDVIWLDFGEMRQIVDAPGKDRGSQHVLRIDEEFIRQGMQSEEEKEHDEWLRRRRRADPFSVLFDLIFDD
jgi:Zn-finger nucleic acid-binding protein